MQLTKIFFFGDSICFGQGVSLHKGWIPRISAQLDQLAKNYDREILVVNSSVNGRTTRQALENMPYEIQSHKPDLLVVQFGLNDCNHWESDQGLPRVSLKAFAANLEEIITRAFKFGAKKVFLNTNHPTGCNQRLFSSNITFQQHNERYNQIIREIVAKQDKNVILNDIEKVFFDHAQNKQERLLDLLLPQPDLLHPSEQGHSLYFNTVYPIIEKAVLELMKK